MKINFGFVWFFVGVCVAEVTAGTVQAAPSGVGKLRYDNYSVLKIKIRNNAEISLLKFVRNNPEKFSIWKEYNDVDREVHIMVGPSEIENFKKLLKVYGSNVEPLISDVQKRIDLEQYTSRDSMSSFGWTRYYELSEIEDWLDDMLAAYPNVTEGFTIGQSYEGRTIRGIKISYKAGNPGIFIESNVHAREWITSATATWFIHEILTSEKAEVRQLRENIDWFIIPVFNVDGFVYSHETDRLWRKTRQPILNSKCIGADINRNFNSHWMANGGASSNPCAETFAGSAPFSEPEALALANFIKSNMNRINIYLSFHSYGQYLLSPYGHIKEEFPPNYDHLLSIGDGFLEAVSNLTYGTKYTCGSTAKVLYLATGSTVDWAFTQGIKVAYTIEYRDKGRFGFVLPPVQILPNCEELMAGMLALVKESRALGYLQVK